MIRLREDVYIPSEAMILLCLTDSDRFPTLDSVYSHDTYQAIVMSASVDYHRMRDVLPSTNLHTQRFRAYPASQLLRKKQAVLSELGASKVASHLLEGLTYLLDMNMVHGDLSINNFLLDKDLNVRISSHH